MKRTPRKAKRATLHHEQLETRQLMAVVPIQTMPYADVPASILPAQVAAPQGPATNLLIAVPNAPLGTMLEDGSFLIQKSRLLASARSLFPTAIDAQDLVLVQGSGTITQQASGDWLFRPAANWFGEAKFSYSIVLRGLGGYRTIDGMDPRSYTGQNGSARITPLGLVLTDAARDQAGSAFMASRLDLTRDFATSFRFTLSGGNGGDGIALVIHNDPRGQSALGGGGGGMGYYGIQRSVGVEFDTYVGGHPADTGVGADHVGILVDGTELANRQAFPGFDLRSGPVYAWVDYQAATSTLRVYVSRFDVKPDMPLFTVVQNLASRVGRDGFIGFTGATGYYYDFQAVRAWTVRGWTGSATTTPGSATLTVRPVNDPPVVSRPVNLGFAVSGQLVRITSAQLLANATDVDGDVLSVRNLRASGGRLTVNTDGSWTFTATVRQSTTFTLWYDVSDGFASARASATIVVSPVVTLPLPLPMPLGPPILLPASGTFAALGAGPTGSASKSTR